MIRPLEGRLMLQIETIAANRAPAEAVGLILPDEKVVELPNRSHTPHNRFEILGSDVRLVLEDHSVPLLPEALEQCTLWHSHPGGGVGPSRVDIQNRVSVMSHLVISLAQDETWTPSWY